jgi:hypothetical protein
VISSVEFLLLWLLQNAAGMPLRRRDVSPCNALKTIEFVDWIRKFDRRDAGPTVQRTGRLPTGRHASLRQTALPPLTADCVRPAATWFWNYPSI